MISPVEGFKPKKIQLGLGLMRHTHVGLLYKWQLFSNSWSNVILDSFLNILIETSIPNDKRHLEIEYV